MFAVADLGFGLPVRVATVLSPGSRVAWYAVVFALGMLCRARPSATPWVGMLESSANLLVLLLSILLPIWSFPLDPTSGAPGSVGLTSTGAANALLSGGAMILSFRRSQDAALAPRGGGGAGRGGSGV